MKRIGLLQKTGWLLMAMALLCSCGNNAASSAQSTATPAPAASAETEDVPFTTKSAAEQTGYGYRLSTAAVSVDASYLAAMMAQDGAVYLLSLDSGIVAEGASLYETDSAAADPARLTLPEGGDVLAVTLAADGGHFWYLLAGEDGAQTLVEADKQGVKTQEIPLQTAIPGNVVSLAVGGDGAFYLGTSNTLYVYDAGGNQRSALTLSGYLVGLTAVENGQVLLAYGGDGGTSVSRVNSESIGRSLVSGTKSYTMYHGAGNTVLLSDGSNLYTLDAESGALSVVLNWIDTDVNPTDLVGVAALDGENFVLLLTPANAESELGFSYELGTLTRTPAEDLPSQTMLQLGCDSTDSETVYRLQQAVIAFNGEQNGYRVHLVDYTGQGEQLAADAGSLDLLLSETAPEEALLDLTDLMDDTVGPGTLVPAVDTCVQDNAGARRYLPLFFTVSTLYGSEALCGAGEGWTPEAFLAAVQALPPAAAVRQFSTGGDFLDELTQKTGRLYGSGADNTFGGTGFAALVEAVRGMPESDEAIYSFEANTSAETAYALVEGGMLMLSPETFTTFTDLRCAQVAYGAGAVRKGYPMGTGNGAVLDLGPCVGISAQTKERDGAWAFLKSLVTAFSASAEEHGDGFPVLEQDLEAQAAAAQAGGLVWILDSAQELPAMSEAELQAMLNYVKEASVAADCPAAVTAAVHSAYQAGAADGLDAAAIAAGIQKQVAALQ